MKERKFWRKAERPITTWLHRAPPRHLPSFTGKLTKLWKFSMTLHIERRKLSGYIITIFQNARKTSGWEKLVILGKKTTVYSLRGVERGSQATQRSTPKGVPQKRETGPPIRQLTWNKTHCTISPEKERSRYLGCTVPQGSSPYFSQVNGIQNTYPSKVKKIFTIVGPESDSQSRSVCPEPLKQPISGENGPATMQIFHTLY